jgi:hypothetical protein
MIGVALVVVQVGVFLGAIVATTVLADLDGFVAPFAKLARINKFPYSVPATQVHP